MPGNNLDEFLNQEYIPEHQKPEDGSGQISVEFSDEIKDEITSDKWGETIAQVVREVDACLEHYLNPDNPEILNHEIRKKIRRCVLQALLLGDPITEEEILDILKELHDGKPPILISKSVLAEVNPFITGQAKRVRYSSITNEIGQQIRQNSPTANISEPEREDAQTSTSPVHPDAARFKQQPQSPEQIVKDVETQRNKLNDILKAIEEIYATVNEYKDSLSRENPHNTREETIQTISDLANRSLALQKDLETGIKLFKLLVNTKKNGKMSRAGLVEKSLLDATTLEHLDKEAATAEGYLNQATEIVSQIEALVKVLTEEDEHTHILSRNHEVKDDKNRDRVGDVTEVVDIKAIMATIEKDVPPPEETAVIEAGTLNALRASSCRPNLPGVSIDGENEATTVFSAAPSSQGNSPSTSQARVHPGEHSSVFAVPDGRSPFEPEHEPDDNSEIVNAKELAKALRKQSA